MNDKKRKIVITILSLLIIIGIIIVFLNIYVKDETSSNKDNKPKEEEQTGNKPSDKDPNKPKPPYDGDVEKVEKPTNELDDNQKYVQNQIKKFNEYLIDPTKTAKDYASLTGLEAMYFKPMVGLDSEESLAFPKEYRKDLKENITNYETKQSLFVKKLSDNIKANYKYKLIDAPLYNADKSQLVQKVEVVSFSYSLYQRDSMEITNELLKMAKVTPAENLTFVTQHYKARIKTMEILNNQLSNYKSNEKFTYNVVYNLKPNKSCNDCHIYINYTQGEYVKELAYKNGVDFYEKNRDKRINAIIEKAIKDKILDKNNPLKLK